MVSLQDFSNFPKPGEISLYEKDGQLCSLPASEIDLTNYSRTNVWMFSIIYAQILLNTIISVILLPRHKHQPRIMQSFRRIA